MQTTAPAPSKPVADSIRSLAMDAVQQANSGHPGMPLGMADAAACLWVEQLKFDPAAPAWPDRDRFVLSGGHGSMLLYALLHLAGYALPLDEIKQFRQWGSHTPGHPEYGETVGVETTTGPLGQGIGNAVGMAIAEQWLAARFNRPGYPLVDHRTFVIAGDGDLMEGVAHEACALAGHLGLGKLIVLYDDNRITIDGSTDLAFSEDVAARFDAYGWQTIHIDGHAVEAVQRALAAALADETRPTLIACRTVIGYGSPHKAGSAAAHGEPLGVEEIARTRAALGLPQIPFWVDPAAYSVLAAAAARGAQRHADWQALLVRYGAAYPVEAAEFARTLRGELPTGWQALPLPVSAKPIATRVASGQMLNALAAAIPELLGGSADLTGSNKTAINGAQDIQRGAFGGRYLRYGVREHGMGAIMNGLALHGGVIPYGGTFLAFVDYMRPTLRLAALMKQQVIYVFTHDSIGLGEDGPTHQPVEQLASLRAMPNLHVIRPADAGETAVAWRCAIARRDGPTALVLTRQDLPVLPSDVTANADKGGYVLLDSAAPQVLLLATGSEVHIAVAAYQALAAAGVAARVVSLPCWELFARQPEAYRAAVLPPHITARVAVEAGSPFGWERFVGRRGAIVALDHYGASAPYEQLYREFGLTAEAVVAAAHRQLDATALTNRAESSTLVPAGV